MGIGNADGSNGQPKLLLWLDGETPLVSNGQDVTLWPDKSGNGNDFVADPATSPILRTASGPNGKPYLEFSREDNRMALENLEIGNQGVSVFYVFRTSDGNYGIFSYADASEPRKLLVQQSGGENRFTVDGDEYETSIGNLSNNTWRHAGFIWDGVTNPTYWHRSSGTNNPEQTQDNVLNGRTISTTGTAIIGHIQNSLNGGYNEVDAFEGDIAEIFIYDGKVNKAMLRMTNSYFRAKYNIGGTGGWDKLQAPAGYRETPILIGRDQGSSSEHRHSRSDGLVLRANPGGMQGSYAYVGAAHSGVVNAESAANLPATVEKRWSRDWFIRKSGLQNGSDIQIGFSFGEGINGEFPTLPDNYVLLHRSGTSGNYAIRNVSEVFTQDDEVVFRLSGSQIEGDGYYTLGTTNNILSNLTGAETRTWYAYQTGNWSDSLTWTLDGSAAPSYVNSGGDIPADGDAVVIGSGRTVTADLNDRAQSSLQVFGTVDFANTSGHTMATISGNGTIRCAGFGGNGNFPTGNASAFANPNTGGQTVFYGSGFTQNADLELNRIRIDLNSPADQVVLAADFTHNGVFEINTGRFQVNSDAIRTIESFGNVLIESGGSIRVSAPNRTHEWTFHKDLVNEGGDIRFTNRVAPNYTQDDLQRITTRFVNPSMNQRIVANGTSYFSRIVLNKGNNDTYILTISADAEDQFGIFGRSNYPMGVDNPYLDENANEQRNALALINGTLELRDNIFAPLHYGSNNYNINESVTLWVNGGVTGKGPVLMPGAAEGTAIVPYGKILVTDGLLRADCGSGITTRINGLIQVDGGEVYATQIRTSVFGSANVGGMIINGGLVDVDGTRAGGPADNFYIFSLTYPGNLFRMTGGTLRVAGPTGSGLIFINSDPEQTSVSGGTVIADVNSTNNNYRITSRAPFWNLEVKRSISAGTNQPVIVRGGSSDGIAIPDLPLRIENRLTITSVNSPTLQMGTSVANSLDAFIKGNFVVESGGVYGHFENTTHFTGGSNSLLSLPTTTTQTFHNVVVEKNDASRFAQISAGNTIMAMEVQGDFRVERGFFNNTNRNVRILGDVINRQAFGVESATGVVSLEGTATQEIFSDNGIFHNLTLNNANDVVLTNGDLRVRRTMRLEDGCNFILGTHKLRVESNTGEVSVDNPETNPTTCFVTDGSPGAGGLEVIFRTADQATWFNLGVEDAGAVKHTPAFVQVNGNFDDEGFIRIVPVDERLSLLDYSTATDYLNFYWNVSHTEFEQRPNVSHMFVYDDVDIEGDVDNFASGRVLSDSPFERQLDGAPAPSTDHVNAGSRRVYYNNTDVAESNTGSGIPITNAAYTAGHEDLFDGRPQVFYSRNSFRNADFNTATNWNELGQFDEDEDDVFVLHGTGAGVNTEFPQDGDIAFIGFDPGSGRPHSYRASTAGVTAADVRFTPMQNAGGDRLPRFYEPADTNITVLRPTLSFSTTAEIENINSISGEGAILMRGDVDLSVVDLGNFLVEDSSIVMAQPESGSLTLTHLPAEVPNLFVTSSDNGNTVNGLSLSSNVNVRGDFEIVGNARFNLSTGVAGDITVGRDLKLAKYQATTSSPRMSYGNTGTVRSIEVLGNLSIEGDGSRIEVQNPNASPQQVHNLTVHKNIYQNMAFGAGLNLFSNATSDFITLTLRGSGNHTFVNENTDGDAPNLGRLVIDKGNSLSSGFSFNSLINVDAPADGETKPIELRNGLLTINDAATNITLSDGGKNFVVPATAGLALEAGTLRIANNEIGMNLSGLLKVDGGLVQIGDAEGENNYIEYSSGGNARIEVNGGQLFVGSQVRQGLTNTAGILDYIQTGGEVRLGIYGAPSANRPVLEVVNDGSRFDLTGGSLTLVRGINSTSVPSLRLEPDEHNITASAELIVGNAGSPAGAQLQNIGIQSEIRLPSLRINNDSGNNPVVKIYTSNLTIEDLLDIASGATFETGIYNLTVRGDIDNDGSLLSTDGKLILDHSSAMNEVTGLGVFDLNNLDRIGGGTTVFNTNLLVKGNFNMDDGIASFGNNEVRVQGDAQVDGTLNFTTGQGMIMEGSGGQILRRSEGGSSLIGILTIDNPSGVSMIASANHEFTIGEELRMKRGIFNLNGNLLDLGVNVTIEQVNAFGQNNMISTGGALTNFGVRKAVAPNTVEDLFMPLGLDKYMPIRLNFSDEDFSSGITQSSYLFRLVGEPQNAVLDEDNVLQMYFSIEPSNVGSGLRMDMELMYDEDYVALTGSNSEEEYIGARLVDNTPPDVFKYGTGVVDHIENIISINFLNNTDEEGIRGDYFAGIDEAIPLNVTEFTTVRDGDIDEGQAIGGVYNEGVPGGGVPSGSVVNVVSDHVLTLNLNGVTLYKTNIEDGATLVVDNTTFHRLGIIEGTGTIRLVDLGSLPTGNYNEFLTCTGGKLEYSGTTDYEILANLPTVKSIAVTGSGTRFMANNDVNVCEDFFVNGANFKFGSQRKLRIERDLLIDAGSFDTDQGDLEVVRDLNITAGQFTSGNEGERIIHGDIIQSGGISSIGSGGTTELLGNYTKSGGTYSGGTASANFVMKGTEEQFIEGDFTGINAFRKLELDNPEGVRLHNNIDVNNTIEFTNGKLFTGVDSLVHLTSESVFVDPPGGAPQSFVNGPMQWSLGTGAPQFFPVGKGDYSRPLRLSNRSVARTWTVEYYDTLATSNPAVASLVPNDPLNIATMSVQEYWRVNSNTGDPTNARVGLSWGDNSVVAVEPGDYDKLLVMQYIEGDGLWGSLGGENFTFNSGNNLGSFISTSNASFSESFFTLGSGDPVNPLPVTWLYFDGETDGKHHTLNWATASEINNDYFELERSVDGRFFTSIARIEGAGNTTSRLDYSYVDKLAPTGRVYYRLRQVDYNGEYEYADEIVTLLREEGERDRLDFLLYPNPTSEGSVRLMISDFEAEMAIISISDLSGQVLLRKAVWIDEQGISDFIPTNFAPGAYIVSVIHDAAMRSKPLIITR